MQAICEQMMEDFILEFEEIEDPIYSDSVFYLTDKVIDDEIERRKEDIFNRNSDESESDIVNSIAKDLETALSMDDEEEFEIVKKEPDNDYKYNLY